MIPPATSRDALLIELLGEMSGVLDRAEELLPAFETGQRGMTEACGKLLAQLATMEVRMVGITEAAQNRAVKHIAQRSDEATRQILSIQVRAMQEAARMLFLKELGPALQALVQPLQRLKEDLQRRSRLWDAWLTHAATASVASLCTWLATTGVWRP